MPAPTHPLVDEAFRLTDAAADNVRTVAALHLAGHLSLEALVAAVDTYRDADRELEALRAQLLRVNGRAYALRRTVNVRGEV